MRLRILFILVLYSSMLQAQELLKDIGAGTANTTFKGFGEAETVAFNDTLPLIKKEGNLESMSFTVAGFDSVYKVSDLYAALGKVSNVRYFKKHFIYSTIDQGYAKIVKMDMYGQKTVLIQQPYPQSNNLGFYQKTSGEIIILIRANNFTSIYYYNSFGLLNYVTALSQINYPTLINNIIYFSGEDASSGAELWRSDGSTSGTYLNNDIIAGTESSYPLSFSKGDDGMIYFSASPASGVGHRLFKTNGLPNGTSLVYSSTNDFSSYYPQEINKIGDYIYFNSYTKFIRYHIPTNTAVDLLGFDSGVVQNFVLNQKCYSIRNVPNLNRIELWQADETGAVLIKTMLSGTVSVNNYQAIWKTNNFCFIEFVENYTESADNKISYWLTDGTTLGTNNISTLDGNLKIKNNRGAIGVVGNQFYFCDNRFPNGIELMHTDGVQAPIAITRNENKFSSNPYSFISDGNNIYFIANDNENGTEVWKSDGTTNGTVRITDNIKFNPRTYNGNTFLGGYDKLYKTTNGFYFVNPSLFGLMHYNTNTSTLNKCSSINIDWYQDYNYTVPEMGTLGSGIVFTHSQYPENAGKEPYYCNNGTSLLLSDIVPGYFDSYPYKFVEYSPGKSFFFVNNSIWKTNGTAIGTNQFVTFGSNLIFNGPHYQKIGNTVYFNAYNQSSNQYELWRATESSFAYFDNISLNSSGDNYWVIDDFIYYYTLSSLGNWKLYRLDEAGVQTLLYEGSTQIHQVLQAGSKILVKSYNSSSLATELYKLNNGVLELVKAFPNVTFLDKIQGKLTNGKTMFSMTSNDLSAGGKLFSFWITDGTAGGTQELLKFKESEYFSYFNSKSILLNNKLIFSLEHSKTGNELWVVDFSCPNEETIAAAIDNPTAKHKAQRITLKAAVSDAVQLRAGNAVLLEPGTEIDGAHTFKATIENCIN